MQTHPGTQFAQRTGKLGHARFHWAAIPEAWAVFHIHAISTGVLRYHEQFLHARAHQGLRLAHHLTNRAADQIAAHRRDDAERTTMVAAFGYLQIGVMSGCKFDATRWNQVFEWIMRFRQGRMHRQHDLIQRMRPGNRQHLGMRCTNHIALGTETTGDDHLAVFRQRFTYRLKRLLYGSINKPARIDDHHVRIVIAADNAIAFCTQLGKDTFGVDCCLRAAERNKPDCGRARGVCFGYHGVH